MNKKYELRIETWQAAGVYQHAVTERGIGNDRKGEVSEEVVGLLKKVAEKHWDDLPVGSGKVVTKIEYDTPKD
tara:strand:+ start:573 stop:791 length:219 start_codon:yes stop_codon:yes gene_type:complete